MLFKSTTLLVSAFLFSSLAEANCQRGEEIDLRKIDYSVFQNIQVKDQGDFGICYAHAASTMIDIIRIKNKSPHSMKKTDPMAAAIHSTIETDELSIEGGTICEVVNGLSKRAYACDHSGLSVKQIKGLGGFVKTKLIEKAFQPYVLKLKAFVPVDLKMINQEVRKKNSAALSADQKEFLKSMDEFMEIFHSELQIRGISKTNLPNEQLMFGFFQDVQVKNTWYRLEADLAGMLIKGACDSSRFEMPKLRCDEYSNQQSDLIEIVDSGLRKSLPTGASICSSFLSDSKYKGLYTNGNRKSDCGEHAVVVIGKREQNGVCQYLIRNSWGYGARYAWPSSNGDVWVDEFALRANFYEAQVVR